MAEAKSEVKAEDQQNFAVGNNSDPKDMQELTNYVSRILIPGLLSHPFDHVLSCF